MSNGIADDGLPRTQYALQLIGLAGDGGVPAEGDDEKEREDTGEEERPDEQHPVFGARRGHGRNRTRSDVVSDEKEAWADHR